MCHLYHGYMGKTLPSAARTITGTQPAESAWKKRMASAEWRRNALLVVSKWHLSPWLNPRRHQAAPGSGVFSWSQGSQGTRKIPKMRGCESSNREMLNDFDFDFDLEETEEMGKTWIATSSERKQKDVQAREMRGPMRGSHMWNLKLPIW